ncbi:MAG: hypothetical protein ACE5JU_09270 [Candidatus Binatia bacterium]
MSWQRLRCPQNSPKGAGFASTLRPFSRTQGQYFESLTPSPPLAPARLRKIILEHGRDPNQFKTSLYYGICVDRDRDEAFREAKAFLDAYYDRDFNREGVEIWTACGPVEHCVRCIQGFIDTGVDHITVRPIGRNLDEQFYLYVNEVLPALGVTQPYPLAKSQDD